MSLTAPPGVPGAQAHEEAEPGDLHQQVPAAAPGHAQKTALIMIIISSSSSSGGGGGGGVGSSSSSITIISNI